MTSQTDLEKLEYTQNWLDFGILSEEFLVKQLAEFEQGEDKNTEHFRYATFSQFIRKHDRFSDLQVQNFIRFIMLAFGKTIRNLANQKLKRTKNPYQTTR